MIRAEVSYSGKGFAVKINDVTKGNTWSTSTKVNQAQRSSAEWIVEAPYSGGVLPLADFGTVGFGSQYTGVASTCTATIGGSTGDIGSFSSNTPINMVTSSGNLKDTTSSLTNEGSSFTVTWDSAGP